MNTHIETNFTCDESPRVTDIKLIELRTGSAIVRLSVQADDMQQVRWVFRSVAQAKVFLDSLKEVVRTMAP